MNPFAADQSNALHTRRHFLQQTSAGLSALALSSILGADGLAADGNKLDPLAPKKPHHTPRAKSVIWLFLEGGPSHLDTFDPKPELLKLAGQPMPLSFGRPITAMGTASNTIMPSQRVFKPYGQSGLPVSDWLPNIAQHADDLAVIRSCWMDGLNHVGSVCQMNTGSILAGRPSMGAWATYGLGTANQNLPTYVVMADGGEVLGGTKNWSAGFLPAVYQGTQFRASANPVYYVKPPDTISDAQQRGKLDFLKQLNERYSADKPDDSELLARLNSYELAYRMQVAAPEAVDLSKESDATKKLYGIGDQIWAVRKVSPFNATAEMDKSKEGLAEATPELEDLGRRCGALFGLDLFGVDCIETDAGVLIIEINDYPNYTNVPEANERLAEYVIRQTEKRK